MPLSEYEQRVLAQLEQELGSDAHLDRAMSRRPGASRRVLFAVIGVVAGLGVMLWGVTANIPLVGVIGFALMVASALWALLGRSTRKAVKPSAESKEHGTDAKKKPTAQGQSFMTRMEERFEKRRQGDDH